MKASTNGSAEPLHAFHAGLTIGQAASMLGVSPSTVRRWVRSGRLRSDQVAVGEGFEYRIPPESLEAVKGFANPCMEPTVEASLDGSMDASAPPIVDASMERSAALAAYNAQLVAPLAAVIERQSETIRGQAETIGGLTSQVANRERELGRFTAELEAERAARQQLLSERDAAETSRRRDHRRLRIGLAVAGALAVAAVLAPAWVR
jgi:excisionase family DNA binding protein